MQRENEIQSMIDKLTQKQKISEEQYKKTLSKKVMSARILNMKQDVVAVNAKNIHEKKEQ